MLKKIPTYTVINSDDGNNIVRIVDSSSKYYNLEFYFTRIDLSKDYLSFDFEIIKTPNIEDYSKEEIRTMIGDILYNATLTTIHV